MLGTAALTSYADGQAFEIFGFKLFGSDEEDEQDIADPLNYTVTLTVEGGDEELKEKLDKASSLVPGRRAPGVRLARPAGQGARPTASSSSPRSMRGAL